MTGGAVEHQQVTNCQVTAKDQSAYEITQEGTDIVGHELETTKVEWQTQHQVAQERLSNTNGVIARIHYLDTGRSFPKGLAAADTAIPDSEIDQRNKETNQKPPLTKLDKEVLEKQPYQEANQRQQQRIENEREYPAPKS
ncbi:hypothetical protein GCM10007392_33110 [Saccharospirillum salsuginis]|uniref:Uncharacterized protein n=1 Tax=Saccharospirillum salsuginis TaxID=418750 RepID=A0A918NF46_9GAMM|nr:hypothetical protein GCM10007392_33110 [Saccharospirillum salsuginis]